MHACMYGNGHHSHSSGGEWSGAVRSIRERMIKIWSNSQEKEGKLGAQLVKDRELEILSAKGEKTGSTASEGDRTGIVTSSGRVNRAAWPVSQWAVGSPQRLSTFTCISYKVANGTTN